MANEEIQVPDVTVRGFWARIEKGDDCWLWRGAMRPNGYGGYVMNRVPVYAHRLSWQIHHGPIPAGLFVCHRCDVKRCVRPDHLFLGTRQENMDDMKRKGRQAHGPTHVARARVSAVKGSAHYNAAGVWPRRTHPMPDSKTILVRLAELGLAHPSTSEWSRRTGVPERTLRTVIAGTATPSTVAKAIEPLGLSMKSKP